ncbi:hypothetical protein D3C76_1682420 [compost metagenome]
MGSACFGRNIKKITPVKTTSRKIANMDRVRMKVYSWDALRKNQKENEKQQAPKESTSLSICSTGIICSAP